MSTAAFECPLTPRQQLRNVWLYSFNVAMTYFAAPVMYVGVLQSALCKHLEKSDDIANLPGSAYLWATPIPVLIIWYFPQVRALKKMMVASYLLEALVSLLFLGVLYGDSQNSSLARQLVVPMLVLHGAVLGVANGVANTCLWEVLGRGVSAARRGLAFTLAFGFGPFLAVVGSLGSQLILGKKETLNFGEFAGPIQPALDWLGTHLGSFGYPLNYGIIFGACVPAMLLSAVASAMVIVPMSDAERQEPIRPKLDRSNLGLHDFFGNRLIQLAAVAYVFVYAAEQIGPNMNTYIQDLLGRKPEEYTGLCNVLRFGCKIVAGFVLGWLVIYSGPKMTLYVTAFLSLIGIAWAMRVTGTAYLWCFGIMGAGELFGNYYPNYIALCSHPHQVRRNMSYTNMITAAAGFAGVTYGSISKRWGIPWSFYAAFGFGIAALAVVVLLPKQPKPPAETALPPRET